MSSVHLVGGAEIHEERLVAHPSNEHVQIVVGAERAIGAIRPATTSRRDG
jgi:hypothetical protein